MQGGLNVKPLVIDRIKSHKDVARVEEEVRTDINDGSASLEKTVDCYNPEEGLMPASFKIKIVPLDGRNGEFEDVLDPAFSESAIASVDYGEKEKTNMIIER
ncbi:hypothetical protein H5410_003997 [Solanum commersonii]|uniref:Uncharacterized protein n=1 Tax=Solanum commersonii TaxID=4109 RepID=A0A9J6B6J1_SOLCO|nr:hypothetical protein H5410_003997 [Solanum commersonii]